jgi:hypothetical protein
VPPTSRHSTCTAKVSATNQLKALIVGAPEELRAELRGLATKSTRDVRRDPVRAAGTPLSRSLADSGASVPPLAGVWGGEAVLL